MSKAVSEGDLATTVKALAKANEALQTANANCMTTAADHEATVAARNEELKVIAEAKKILTETSGGAVGQSYSMFQLASRIAAVIPYGAADGADVFGKIKGLISDLIAK